MSSLVDVGRYLVIGSFLLADQRFHGGGVGQWIYDLYRDRCDLFCEYDSSFSMVVHKEGTLNFC